MRDLGRLWRSLRVPAIALLSALITALAGAAPASANFRYNNPRVNGAVVDWCSTWATNCGWGGAHQFCRTRGHPSAVNWNTYRPGRTWVIGSNNFCNGGVCVGFSQVTCATAAGPGPGPGPGGEVFRFNNPRMQGATVDWCSTWATNCGWGGANQFCQSRGYSRALNWNTFRPGRTWVMGSNTHCNGGVCVGFSHVTCRR